jgi:ribonuclease R
VGHFALASESYCHFTSPIRRYPDLTVHRLLDAYLGGVFDTPKGLKKVPNTEELTVLGNECSTNERRAESAERELRLVLILRLLEAHVGEPFDGVVTGVANVGVFVQLDRFLVEGLLRFTGLPDDWWEVDTRLGSVIGERSGHRITIGDRLTVSIAKINVPARQIDLALERPLQKVKRKGGTRRSGDDRPQLRGGDSRSRQTMPGRGKGMRRPSRTSGSSRRKGR